jgi:adenylate cyclase
MEGSYCLAFPWLILPVVSSKDQMARESRAALRRLQHEMRTPIGQIIGYSEMLLEEAREDHEDFVADLEKIHGAAEGLLVVVDETLQTDAGPQRPTPRTDGSGDFSQIAKTSGRILVVDDEPNNRDLLGRRLERHGYRVDRAEDGVTALRMIERERFDLVLLDVMMPGMSGHEVLDVLRRDRSVTELPVILVTALSERDDIVEGLRHGANDFVSKPIDMPILLARIETQLAALASARELESLAQELELRSRFIRRMFGRYVSDDVADTVMGEAENLELGGEKREVSILMSDLVGFTPLTESLDASQVVTILNNHLGVMIDVIQSHGGTIDEFIGDAILAFFGAPLAHGDDPARAVACALAMQAGMAQVNAKNAALGLPEVAMRISVSTGDVVVGNIGSERRSKYAAVGSAINLAARIELHSGGGDVVISDETRRQLGSVLDVTKSWEVVAKGFADPIRIHRVCSIDASFDD